MGLGRIVDAVVEFGDAARAAGQLANQFAKTPEAAALFGNRDRKQGLAFLAHFGPLGHKAQAVEIHVGAAQNRGVGFASGLVRGHILLDGRHGQRTGGLDNAARVDKHILDGGADSVGIDSNELIHQLAADAKGFFADQLDGRAVRKQAHVVQGHALFGAHRLHHGIGVVHLHANHLDLGTQGLDVVGHARNQPAAAYGHKHRVKTAGTQGLQLHEDFHRNRALAGNHVRVVKRMHKRQAALFLQRHRMGVGIRVAVAVQHHLDSVTSPAFDRINLDLRRRRRHDHHGARSEFLRAQRHALGMVAGRGANHAFFELGGA